MTTAAETPQRPPERRLSIDNGKYTFVINKPGDYRVHVLRHGEPWVIVEQGTNAVFSLVHDMIDAGALVAAVRRWATPGDGYQQHEELHQAFRAYCAERGEARPAKLEESESLCSIEVALVVRNALVPARHYLEQPAYMPGSRVARALECIDTVLTYVDGLVKRAQSEGN